MVVAAGTLVIGIVERVNREKRIGSVRPLYHDVGAGWEKPDRSDYPTRGRLFWRKAPDIEEGAVVSCRADHNAHGEDHFSVSDGLALPPVEDLRNLNYADAAEQLRTRMPAPQNSGRAREVYLWCADDKLVGPFKIGHAGTKSAAPGEFGRLDRVPVRSAAQAVIHGPEGKYYYYNNPTVPPADFVDCRSDEEILETALRNAVEVTKEAGIPTPELLSTRTHIQEAASLLRTSENSRDRRNKLARIERALRICSESDAIRSRASELTEQLLSHPTVASELDKIRKSTRAKALAEGRRDFESELGSLREDEAKLRSELRDLEHTLEVKRNQVIAVDQSVSQQLDNLESRVLEKVGQAVDDASELLADSVLFRALGHTADRPPKSTPVRTSRPFSSRNGAVTVNKAPEFDQFLREAANAYGLPHKALRKIHASFRAGLIPVVSGNGATAALAAYATAACAGRITSLPVAHDFLSPIDLLGVRASDPTKQRMHADLLLAASREAEAGGPAMLVLQSVNQAPTESYLLPWLQAPDRTIAVPVAVQDTVGCTHAMIHKNLLVAATAVAGVTTAPLSPYIWGFCVAIDVPAPTENHPGHVTPARLNLGAKLPTATHVHQLTARLSEFLGEYWVLDNGLSTTAHRFGDAHHEIAKGDAVANAIATSILLPALATSLPGPDLDAAAASVAKWCGIDNADTQSFRRLANRFRRRFA
ncbi:MAG: hypothetical protein GX610_01275 [Rhodococcus sp.]|nr:hypothetical protein [Rhodococcus sp. (in: high G+C Gram-positive bacteria)]